MSAQKLIALFVVCVVIGLAHSALNAESQNAQRSVVDGVYTLTQAGRGESLVLETVRCVNCHGSTLRGGSGDTPPLAGPEFISNWQGFSLNDLESKITTMPPNRSEKMNPQDSVDILTFLLQVNGYPAGDDELGADPEVLRQVKIVPLKKP
jgi:mono/diheme cytochrome c family protein